MPTKADFENVACSTPLATFFDDTTPALAADIFTAMTMTADGVIRVTCCMAAAKLSATIVRSGGTATVYFNANANVTASALYVWDMPVRNGDVINFQTSAAVAVEVLNIDFIRQQSA